MEKLVTVVQGLSRAHDLATVLAVVRRAARDLTGADGATFILRDDDKCYYAEENAISPLWKGQRFPMTKCVSGWVMMHGEPAIIPDIYQDERVPVEAYRTTFVKSLLVVPIRADDPIGAIGNYWAKNHDPSEEEIALLQTLANFTSTAIENADLYTQLQKQIDALEISNQELRSFARAASHDLKSPLRGIDNLAEWIEEAMQNGDAESATGDLQTLRRRVRRMEKLLDSVVEYAALDGRHGGRPEEMAEGKVIEGDVRALIDLPDGFTVQFSPAFANVRLPRLAAQRVFWNLVVNGIKHHDQKTGHIEVGMMDEGPNYVFRVKDDGPGIPPDYEKQIFQIFQTLKPRDTVEGSGMGLSLVRKILSRYDGNIAVEPNAGRGAIFRVRWPKSDG